MKPILGTVLLLLSSAALAQAPSGTWKGNASPNMGDPARCTPNMAYELVVKDGKLAGKLDFGTRVQAIDAAVSPDGKFETSFVNPQGHTVKVTGDLADSFTVDNPIRCGYGKIPLKR